ncbi:T9SS type A sorting domain-containing protein [Flavobacterium sp.]|uniref:T9SS type A sorting domain-containing protein n=1 Tax=Flavobacterium sp. TaxID=239 RepID=UPI002633B554|nr:T9SS type A sorting domain-containing protein [Flavobacterium sp.]
MTKNYLFSLLVSLLTTVVMGQVCPVPGNIAVTNITSNSAVINWTGSGTTQWEVYITPAGTAPPNSNTVGTIVTSNPYVVTNLIGCTSYNAYIKAVCSPTQSSNWSAAMSFSTVLGLNSDIPDLEACDASTTGFATFDLTSNNYAVLYGLNPSEYTVSYFETITDAYTNTSALASPTNYVNINQQQMQIYVRVENNTSGCFAIAYFYIRVTQAPHVYLPANGQICYNQANSTATPYTINTNLSGNGYTFQWSKDGVIIAGATGNSFSATTEGTYAVSVQNIITGCSAMASTLLTYSSAVNANATIDDQTITINTTGPGNYQYQIDNEPAQLSNTFENVALGFHSIAVIPVNSSCSPLYLTVQVTTPSAPRGQSTQTFTQGQTLANLVVNGQNIHWYANASAPGLTTTTETRLPLTTVLTHNTTYYASQTINDIESPDRLAVTVQLTALSNEDFNLNKLAYYPNPVTNSLTVSNPEAFTGITVSNLLGQIVFDRKVNSTLHEIDFSNLSKGIYMVRVSANDQSKTFKIIKE